MLVYVLPSGRMLDSGCSRQEWDFVVIQIPVGVVGRGCFEGFDGTVLDETGPAEYPSVSWPWCGRRLNDKLNDKG